MIVLSVGGSVINPGEPDRKMLSELSLLLKKAHKKTPIAVVTGGGKPARVFAGAIRALHGSQFLADKAAILATRQNAMLLIAALGDSAWPVAPENFEDAALAAASGKIVVMGGTIPGITTDTDAALLAELLGAKKIINVSNVDGLYTSDPRTDASAKKMQRVPFSGLVALASKSDSRNPGENFVFDIFACKIAARSKIEVHFVGPDAAAVECAIFNRKHSGTIVRG